MGVCLTVLAGLVLLCIASGPSEDIAAQRLLSVARTSLEACGESATCKSISADVWILRRRLATRDELVAMGVQAEEGDEACLCGKSSATVPEWDRQARLLAEATVLFHLAGDGVSAERNLARLRNVAHKGSPTDNATAWQLLLRMVMIRSGADAALREAGPLDDAALRLHSVSVAADCAAVDAPVRRKVLQEMLSEFRALKPTDAPAHEAVAKVLALSLWHAGLEAEARGVMPERWQSLLAPQPAAPVAAEVRRVAEMVRAGKSPRDIARAVEAFTGDTAAYYWGECGAQCAAAKADINAVAREVRSAACRAAFVAGALRTLTAADERARFDTVISTLNWPG